MCTTLKFGLFAFALCGFGFFHTLSGLVLGPRPLAIVPVERGTSILIAGVLDVYILR